jgi:hypothetical protein
MTFVREHLLATSIAMSVVALLADSPPAIAQPSGRPVEASVGVAAMRLSELDETNVGIRGAVDVHIARAFAIEGALTWFPGAWNSSTSVLDGQKRLLGFAGVKAVAVTTSRVELFGRGGVGFLSFASQEGTTPSCPSQIVTTTLACGLAIGYTAFTTEIGGGASIALDAHGRLRVRVDAADLLVRYGSVVARSNGRATDGFFSHNILTSASVGWRF